MKKSSSLTLVSLLMFILVLAACGGNDAASGDDNDSGNAQAAPTRTIIPTFAFVPPTNPAVFNQDAESTDEAEDEPAEDTEAVELDPQMVERGLGRYEALECATCHGEGGAGTDDAAALIGYSETEDVFVTFMRSGGEIGTSHQYSTDRLSQNGSRNLYMYLLSLSQEE